jgi:hypothetical protein
MQPPRHRSACTVPTPPTTCRAHVSPCVTVTDVWRSFRALFDPTAQPPRSSSSAGTSRRNTGPGGSGGAGGGGGGGGGARGARIIGLNDMPGANHSEQLVGALLPCTHQAWPVSCSGTPAAALRQALRLATGSFHLLRRNLLSYSIGAWYLAVLHCACFTTTQWSTQHLGPPLTQAHCVPACCLTSVRSPPLWWRQMRLSPALVSRRPAAAAQAFATAPSDVPWTLDVHPAVKQAWQSSSRCWEQAQGQQQQQAGGGSKRHGTQPMQDAATATCVLPLLGMQPGGVAAVSTTACGWVPHLHVT